MHPKGVFTMYIKFDLDFEELKQYINKDNTQLIEKVERNGQQDNFVLFVEKYYTKGVPNVEELNDFIYAHHVLITYTLKLK